MNVMSETMQTQDEAQNLDDCLDKILKDYGMFGVSVEIKGITPMTGETVVLSVGERGTHGDLIADMADYGFNVLAVDMANQTIKFNRNQ